jgi:hypothetical protein
MGNGAPTAALPPEAVAADCDAVAALGAEQAARAARAVQAAGQAAVGDPALADLEGADLEELRAHISKYRQTAKMLTERIARQQKIKSVSQTREDNTPVQYDPTTPRVDPADEKQFLRACADGHLHIAKAMLGKGKVDVECQSLSGGTAVMAAAQGGHLEVLKYLRSMGADFGARDFGASTPFLEAARGGRLAVIEYLAGTGKCDIAVRDSQGWTALHAAACYGYLDCVKVLVQKGLKLDDTDIDGKTPLDWAIESERNAVVDFLT